jgi:hypothetical protein
LVLAGVHRPLGLIAGFGLGFIFAAFHAPPAARLAPFTGKQVLRFQYRA